MLRYFTICFLVMSVALSGCQVFSTNQSKTPDSLKKNVFGVHGKNDPNFGKKVDQDPFPTAAAAGVSGGMGIGYGG